MTEDRPGEEPLAPRCGRDAAIAAQLKAVIAPQPAIPIMPASRSPAWEPGADE